MTPRLMLLFALVIALAHAPVGVPLAHGDELDCLIEPHVVVTLTTPAVGLLKTVSVDRGDLVKEGEVLATLDSSVERATVAVTRARAQLTNKRLAELELQRATAELAQRRIRSPFSGVVVERLLSPGEFVNQTPILKLAQIDPLRVEVFAPVLMLGEVSVGMEAQIVPEAPLDGVHTARVTVVDRVVDAASGTFGIRLELPNPDYSLPAGLRCRVQFPPREDRTRKGQ